MSIKPLPARLQPDSRAWEIITVLARRGPLTIAELVREIGVTTTAIRQQVNRLVWEGWLTRAQRRSGPGRPADVFSLTEQARGLFASGVDEFARLLLDEIARVEGDATQRAMVKRVGERIAKQMEPLVAAAEPAERLRKFARALELRGMVADLLPTEDGMRLSVYTCPYHGLADARREICEVERDALGSIAGGEVKLSRCAASGDACCEFDVSLKVEGPQAD